MPDDDAEIETTIAHIRLIAADCFDLRAVERLRSLADRLEQRARVSRTVTDEGKRVSEPRSDRNKPRLSGAGQPFPTLSVFGPV